jgi:hypothetical protein
MLVLSRLRQAKDRAWQGPEGVGSGGVSLRTTVQRRDLTLVPGNIQLCQCIEWREDAAVNTRCKGMVLPTSYLYFFFFFFFFLSTCL